jgi:Exonuclease VII, large subunit
MHTATRDQRDRLTRLESLLVAPTEYIQRKASTVDVQRERLESSMARVVERKHSELKRASGQLHVLSPLATLSRGYGIVLKDAQANDRMIGSVADVNPSDPIEIRLKDGRLDARVESIEKES